MNEEKKVLNLLGLAQRSGKLASGEFQTEKAVKEQRAALVILAADASENTKKKFQNMCTFYRVNILELSGKDALGHGIGRSERSSLAVMDDGFAKAILKALEAYSTRR
jgi:ribosomal protein L7Ae-like RNA K-turn-binding protein